MAFLKAYNCKIKMIYEQHSENKDFIPRNHPMEFTPIPPPNGVVKSGAADPGLAVVVVVVAPVSQVNP